MNQTSSDCHNVTLSARTHTLLTHTFSCTLHAPSLLPPPHPIVFFPPLLPPHVHTPYPIVFFPPLLPPHVHTPYPIIFFPSLLPPHVHTPHPIIFSLSSSCHRNILLYYSTGVTLGIIASILILLYVFSKFGPKVGWGGGLGHVTYPVYAHTHYTYPFLLLLTLITSHTQPYSGTSLKGHPCNEDTWLIRTLD